MGAPCAALWARVRSVRGPTTSVFAPFSFSSTVFAQSSEQNLPRDARESPGRLSLKRNDS